MKNYIFLLLLATFSIQAQTLQNPTYGNVKLKNNVTDNSATKVNVQSTDGTINTISKADLVNVVEVNDAPSLPLIGEAGKIYVVKNINKIYRWNGTIYQELAINLVTSVSGKVGVVTLVKADVGLANVDNTTDLLKPISTATQTALDLKENTFSKNTAFNKNFGTTVGTVVEGGTLGTNAYTSTVFEPSANKATNLTSPNDIKFPTTLTVSNALSGYLPLTGGTLTGVGEILKFKAFTAGGIIAQAWYNSTNVRRGFYGFAQTGTSSLYLANDESGGKILINTTGGGTVDINTSMNATGSVTATSFNGSATLTGTPTAPTATAGTSTTQIATTAFVQNATLTSGTITTATNITTATTVTGGESQRGKTILIANGASNINYTMNAELTASFVKGGTGTITFVQGSGRTLVAPSGLIFNGIQGSTASVTSFGTTDYVYINNF